MPHPVRGGERGQVFLYGGEEGTGRGQGFFALYCIEIGIVFLQQTRTIDHVGTETVVSVERNTEFPFTRTSCRLSGMI